jgi:lysophospholipase L1-like esterase
MPNRAFLSLLALGFGSLGVVRAQDKPDQAKEPAATTTAAPPAGARGPRPPAPQSVSPRDALPWTPGDFNAVKPGLPTLIIAGDSTADKGPDAWHRGWAALLIDYFDPTKINVVNRARGGRSFRSFVHEGLWDQLLAHVKPGDIVMIQFGHNDGGDIKAANGRPDLPGLGAETQTVTRADGTTEVVHTFGWYARTWIADVRAKKATPILMSQTVYNRWTDGHYNRKVGNIYTWMKQVADAEKVPFLDHTNLIADRYEQLGQEAVKPFFAADPLHTTTFGGIVNAELFVAGVKAMKLEPLVGALNERGQAIAALTPSAGAAASTSAAK